MSDTNSQESVVVESNAAVTETASKEQTFNIQDFSKADETTKMEMFRNWRRSEQPEQKAEEEVEEPNTEEVEQEERQEIDLTTIDDFDKIDPNKLSPENFKLYKHMEKLMQRKSQNLSAEMREIQQMKTQLQQLSEQSKPQEKPIEKVNTVLGQAKQLAMQMVGITDPSEFKPDATGLLGDENHYAALQIAMQYVSNDVVQREMSNQRAANIKKALDDNPSIKTEFESAMWDLVKKGNTDQFQVVFEAQSRFKNGAATMQDMDIMEQHWASVQSSKTPKVEPKIVKEKPLPPKVESSGPEFKQDKPAIDIRKFRNTTDEDEKRAMIRAARRNGQI
jgi:hypothetical protein